MKTLPARKRVRQEVPRCTISLTHSCPDIFMMCPPSPHPNVLSWERKLPSQGIKHLACNISQSTGGSRGRPCLLPTSLRSQFDQKIFSDPGEEWVARICKVDASILINALPPFTGVPECCCLPLDNRKTSKSREWRKCWLIEVWSGREPSQYCKTSVSLTAQHRPSAFLPWAEHAGRRLNFYKSRKNLNFYKRKMKNENLILKWAEICQPAVSAWRQGESPGDLPSTLTLGENQERCLSTSSTEGRQHFWKQDDNSGCKQQQ